MKRLEHIATESLRVRFELAGAFHIDGRASTDPCEVRFSTTCLRGQLYEPLRSGIMRYAAEDGRCGLAGANCMTQSPITVTFALPDEIAAQELLGSHGYGLFWRCLVVANEAMMPLPMAAR